MYLYWFEQSILLRGSGCQRQNDDLPHLKRIENIAAQNLTAQPKGEILIDQRGAAGPARNRNYTKREESKMSNRKQRRSLLGLVLVAALGLMAFASSAQALTPLFYVDGLPAPAALNATVTGKQLGVGKLLVAALNVEIRCEKFSVQEGVLLDNKLAHGKLLYENCTVWDHTKGTRMEPCQIVTNHELLNSKEHITATALFLPAETTAGAPAILAEKIVANVLIHEGLGCVLPKTTPIKGELCLKLNNNHAAELEVESSAAIVCRERPALESLSEGAGIKDKLLFGINEAFVIAKADLSILGKTIGVLLD